MFFKSHYDDDKLKEECGVAGICGSNEASYLVYLSLHALQHRGQEACGIVSFEKTPDSFTRLHTHKAFGLVADTVKPQVIKNLPGHSAIGHVRYSTQGGSLVENIQPFQFKTALGPIALAHNGNLTNAKQIRHDLEAQGSIFQSTSDTEVFIHLILRSSKATVREKIAEAMSQVDGAYSLIVMTKNELFGVRDPKGFRPLVFGEKIINPAKNETIFIIASETCALDLIDAKFVRDVKPGEILEIAQGKVQSFFFHENRSNLPKKHFCSFEPIYFSRPDSLLENSPIYNVRKKIGQIIAKNYPAPEADIVIAVPDSGVPMAMGYAAESGLPYEIGLVRNHYIGRTFIQPTQEIRDFSVRLKLNPVNQILKGKSVVVIDDSIVRGTTSAKIIRMLRDAGAKKIHLRIGSPPVTHSCFYGVDTPKRSQLLASTKNTEAIREFIGSDTLAFLTIEELKQALPGDQNEYCFACFSGKYVEPIHQEV